MTTKKHINIKGLNWFLLFFLIIQSATVVLAYHYWPKDFNHFSISTSDHQIFIVGIILTVTILVAALWFIPYFISSTFTSDLLQLENDILIIDEKKDYELTISTNLGTGLANVATLINQLIKNVKNKERIYQQSETELKNLQSSLKEQVFSRTQELEQAVSATKLANETKTTFLATMSHEIRTPMNGVIGTIDLLRHTELDPPQYRLSSIIRDSAFSLLGILDDILDFSKIEAGKLDIESTPFSLAQVLEEVARVMSSIANKKNIELELFIDPQIPDNLLGDMVRIRQVIYNLASNAIKFTQTDDDQIGKVSISANLISTTHDFYNINFVIQDNGRGMTDLQQAKIFMPFSQAEDSITREFGGTGLGLSICKSLTQLMFGDISVESTNGLGSKFTVFIPFTFDENINFEHKNKLKGKKVALYSPNQNQNQELKSYISYLGADIISFDDLSEKHTWQEKDNLIWLLNGIGSMSDITQFLDNIHIDLKEKKHEVIILSQLSEAKLSTENIFYLNALPLSRTNLFTSLLVAAGLHKPNREKQTKFVEHKQLIADVQQKKQVVLLIEDNIMNQQVISEQLHLLGYGVDVAEDGEHGLEMWRKKYYPFILTDLHMPKMSGYELVKAIKEESPLRDDTPKESVIIAITANALKGEREKCLALGMNDYLTKPVELSKLEVMVKKWFALDQSSVTISPVNLKIMKEHVGNDPERHVYFLSLFVEQTAKLINELKQIITKETTVGVDSISHQLKSTAKNIGAMAIAKTADSLEAKYAENAITQHVLEHFRDELEQQFFEVQEFVNQFKENNK